MQIVLSYNLRYGLRNLIIWQYLQRRGFTNGNDVTAKKRWLEAGKNYRNLRFSNKSRQTMRAR
jgi:hypothetical protein